MIVEASNGETYFDVVICAKCGCASLDIDLVHCPQDGTVLGERSMTADEITDMPPMRGHAFPRF